MAWTQEEGQSGNNSDDDESPDISKWESVIWLSIMTAWISILSEYLVGAIEVPNVNFSVTLANLTNIFKVRTRCASEVVVSYF